MHGIWKDGRDLHLNITGFRLTIFKNDVKLGILQVLLSIESHFVGVHGPYELHRKEKQIYTALENLLFFPMQFIWPMNTDKMRFNTYIYIFLYARLQTGRIMIWWCPSVRVSVCPSDSPSVRSSVRVSVCPFSALFSYMLWHIELRFCTWLCSYVLQIKFVNFVIFCGAKLWWKIWLDC